MVLPKRLINNQGSIAIRFTYRGYRFLLGKLGRYDDAIARDRAKAILHQIRVDLASGYFQCSSNDDLAKKYNSQPTLNKTGDLIDRVRALPQTSVTRPLLGHLQGFTGGPDAFISKLQKRGLKGSTIKRYISVLASVSSDWKGITIKGQVPQEVKPFTAAEVLKILDWFKTSRYYSYWHDYVLCLLYTGMRPGEATALQSKHIDFEAGVISIREAFSDPLRNGKRVRKQTKTGITRQFPISAELKEMLSHRFAASHVTDNPESLIFTSPRGNPLDPRMFQRRPWKNCLSELGIEYRKPYAMKHTFSSHAIRFTGDPIKIASLTHNSRSGAETLLKHYARSVDSQPLPDIYQ